MLKSFFIVGSRPGFLLAVETRRDTQILPFYHFVLPDRSLSLSFSDAFGKLKKSFDCQKSQRFPSHDVVRANSHSGATMVSSHMRRSSLV